MAGLQEEVRDFEPHVALTDGNDGLSIIRRIVTGSPQFLAAGGLLLVEIGFNQSRAVKGMFDRGVWKKVEFLPDLQGIPRLVRAKLK
jgi:release factor glutamine methyltransferase